MVLYDEKEVLEKYLELEIYEACQKARQEVFQKARQEAEMAIAKRMLENDEPIEKIMKYSRLPQSVILELQKEQNQ